MKDELVLQRHLHFHTSVSNLKESGPGSSVPLQKQIIHTQKKIQGVLFYSEARFLQTLGVVQRSMAGYLSP